MTTVVSTLYDADELRELTDEEWSTMDYFTKEEFACQETGEHGATRALVLRVNSLRTTLNRPLIINSGFRSPRHSIERKKRQPGTHAMGMAVDIKCSGDLAYADTAPRMALQLLWHRHQTKRQNGEHALFILTA